MNPALSRRRFLSITAAAAGLGLTAIISDRGPQPVSWQGTAMGAEARLTLYHRAQQQAQALIQLCVQEIQRVESWFSLFRRDSVLVQLNRDGQVSNAPAPFVELVQLARHYSRLSDGAFDVTIQPLWALYAGHFARSGASMDGPPPDQIAAARAKVGWYDLEADGNMVRFRRPFMQASFNGIAQGWVTDRVADLLRSHDVTDMLLDLGEMRGLGSHPDGRPWMVGLADPQHPDRIRETVPLRNQAIASSGGYGTSFDPAGRFHHLLDPFSGQPLSRWAGISVTAATATAADALTKAIMLAPSDQIAPLLHVGGGYGAVLIDHNGTTLTI